MSDPVTETALRTAAVALLDAAEVKLAGANIPRLIEQLRAERDDSYTQGYADGLSAACRLARREAVADEPAVVVVGAAGDDREEG